MPCLLYNLIFSFCIEYVECILNVGSLFEKNIFKP